MQTGNGETFRDFYHLPASPIPRPTRCELQKGSAEESDGVEPAFSAQKCRCLVSHSDMGETKCAIVTRDSSRVLTLRTRVETRVTAELSKGSAGEPKGAQPAFFSQKRGRFVSHCWSSGTWIATDFQRAVGAVRATDWRSDTHRKWIGMGRPSVNTEMFFRRRVGKPRRSMKNPAPELPARGGDLHD